MPRKDFEMIAQTIHKGAESFTALQAMAHAFADTLASTNPRFDRARFIAACLKG